MTPAMHFVPSLPSLLCIIISYDNSILKLHGLKGMRENHYFFLQTVSNISYTFELYIYMLRTDNQPFNNQKET